MSKIFYKKLGEKIRSLREKHKYTREEFAEISHVSTYYIGEIERAQKKPSLDILLKISKALKVEITELFTFK